MRDVNPRSTLSHLSGLPSVLVVSFNDFLGFFHRDEVYVDREPYVNENR